MFCPKIVATRNGDDSERRRRRRRSTRLVYLRTWLTIRYVNRITNRVNAVPPLDFYKWATISRVFSCRTECDATTGSFHFCSSDVGDCLSRNRLIRMSRGCRDRDDYRWPVAVISRVFVNSVMERTSIIVVERNDSCDYEWMKFIELRGIVSEEKLVDFLGILLILGKKCAEICVQVNSHHLEYSLK